MVSTPRPQQQSPPLETPMSFETSSRPIRCMSALSKCPRDLVGIVVSELRKQQRITVPLIAMNFMWFAKLAVTTSFLGRLGELPLAGGTIGYTFANVTGFSVLTGLCGAMAPICGQAFGAQNFKLLHKTLLMATVLLLLITLPISLLWISVDKILPYFGQHKDMVGVAKRFILYLLPDLPIISILSPLKAYLSAQGITIPIMISSALAVAFHVPINIVLSKAKGIEGVSMAVWASDLVAMTSLLLYVIITEMRKDGKWKEGGWWDQGLKEWVTLLRLSGPCCLTVCLEWWCYEILVLLTGRLPNAKQAVGALAIVLNFDNLLFSVMLSLHVCASTRVSNELGANQPRGACLSVYVSLGAAAILGCVGAALMIASRGWWGHLFSHDSGVIIEVKKMMVLMAIIEVANFPLTVSGGIVRGTARPRLGMYASLGGFYFLALPLGTVLAFKAKIGLEGLFMGFLAGAFTSLLLLLVSIARINWVREAAKAQKRASQTEESVIDNMDGKSSEIREIVEVSA